jgi:UDP-glucuronate 4-epimerase
MVELRDEKILVTGLTGQVGAPMAAFLAEQNEVWGVARFAQPGSRERAEANGVRTVVVDLTTGDFTGVPDDFTLVIHLATFQLGGLDYDHALTTNAEATGLLMGHCSHARAFLVASTVAVYGVHPNPYHPFVETDPLGDTRQPYSPTYAISKIGEEAVARSVARLLRRPTVIARLNVVYGRYGGLPAYHLEAMLTGEPVMIGAGPNVFCPINQEDLHAQVGGFLEAASVPARIVNWGGGVAVTVEEWCRYLGVLTGVEPVFALTDEPMPSRVTDSTRRDALVGPCRVDWREGMRQMVVERCPRLSLPRRAGDEITGGGSGGG